MVELGNFFVFGPFIIFSAIILLIILFRSCILMSRSTNADHWSNPRRRERCRGRGVATHSVASVEIQTTNNVVPAEPYVQPPGYYSEVMATDSSAMYPVYVPPYSALPGTSPLQSLRDPRRFQGLPGVAAPPPYPAPPSYSQIASYPELPTGSSARLDNRTSSRNGKKGEAMAPVE